MHLFILMGLPDTAKVIPGTSKFQAAFRFRIVVFLRNDTGVVVHDFIYLFAFISRN